LFKHYVVQHGLNISSTPESR